MADSTQSAREIVRQIMELDPVIRNGLARRLINVRALARHIQVATREETTLEALVAAIRRYPVKETAARYHSAGTIIAKLGLKNKIVEVIIRNDPEVPALLGKFAQDVDYARGETLSMVSGAQNVRVVIDSSNLERLTKMIPKKSITKVVRNLAAVVVTCAEPPEGTPGANASIFGEIAMDGINIEDFVQSLPDGLIIVDEKDSLRTYQALRRLSEDRNYLNPIQTRPT